MAATEAKRILLIEDDRRIATELQRHLESWSFEVRMVVDFERVMEAFDDFKPHLVLLDLVLPTHNGYYWCQEIRKRSRVPIIFISSRSENMDIVMAMQYGGDDYITKPLDLAVLVAKIQALLRRSYDFQMDQEFLALRGLNYSPTAMRLSFEGREVDLTKTENAILELLFRKRGDFVTRERLMEQCWLGDEFIDDNTLAVNVSRLRAKIRGLGIDGLIETKKGVGYRLVEDFRRRAEGEGETPEARCEDA